MHSFSMRYLRFTAHGLPPEWCRCCCTRDRWLVLVRVTGCLVVWEAHCLTWFHSKRRIYASWIILLYLALLPLRSLCLCLPACLTFNPSPHHLLLCPFLSLPVCLPSGLTILGVLCDRRDAAVRGINEAAADVCNLGNCSLTWSGIKSPSSLQTSDIKAPSSLTPCFCVTYGCFLPFQILVRFRKRDC